MRTVSVIVPVYNSECLLENTIASILGQEFREGYALELILVDDGSSDKSWSIISGYCSCDESCDIISGYTGKLGFDGNRKGSCSAEHFVNSDTETVIKIAGQEHKGAPAARNLGLSMASGQYIMFFDSDDILLQGALMSMIDIMENENCDIVIGNYYITDSNLKIIKDVNYHSLGDNMTQLFSISSFPGNKLFRHSIIQKNAIVWDDVRLGQDANFYLKYLVFCRSFGYYNGYCSKYRIVEGSISHRYDSTVADIVISLDMVEAFYETNNVDRLYYDCLNIARLCNYIHQMKKLKFDGDLTERAYLYNFFLDKIETLRPKILAHGFYEHKLVSTRYINLHILKQKIRYLRYMESLEK